MRALRAVKNRFGATGELGFFEMSEKGLTEVKDASARLYQNGLAGPLEPPSWQPWRAVDPFSPVQALVGLPSPATPGRTVLGMDRGRMQMLIAVLGKIGHRLYDRDIFISPPGGLKIMEPAGDLAIASAIASSLVEKAIDQNTLIFGEVGLVAKSEPFSPRSEISRGMDLSGSLSLKLCSMHQRGCNQSVLEPQTSPRSPLCRPLRPGLSLIADPLHLRQLREPVQQPHDAQVLILQSANLWEVMVSPHQTLFLRPYR